MIQALSIQVAVAALAASAVSASAATPKAKVPPPGVGSLDLNDIFIRDAGKGGHSEGSR